MTNRPYSSGAALAAAETTLDETSRIGVSWSAIFAGALTATIISLLLLVIGSAVGFVAVSPWPGMGADAKTITVMTLIWMVLTQWISAGLGGYLAGRLRYKWIGVHNHEIFFRDTVHGFLSWALATLATAAFIASLGVHAMHGAAHMADGPRAASGGPEASIANPLAYYADSLFRTTHPDANSADPAAHMEAERILLTGLKNGDKDSHDKDVKDAGISDEDRTYLAQLVAAHTGLSTDDATQRVSSVLAQEENARNKIREKADEARKAAASFGLWVFLSMLVGAFVASTAGALAGKHQDEDYRMQG